MEGNASVYQVYPVSRTTGEGRAVISLQEDLNHNSNNNSNNPPDLFYVIPHSTRPTTEHRYDKEGTQSIANKLLPQWALMLCAGA